MAKPPPQEGYQRRMAEAVIEASLVPAGSGETHLFERVRGQDPLGELSEPLERADFLDLTTRCFRKRPEPLSELQQEDLTSSFSAAFTTASGFTFGFTLCCDLLRPCHRHGSHLLVLSAR